MSTNHQTKNCLLILLLHLVVWQGRFHTVFYVSPANSHFANLGRTKTSNKGDIKLHIKKEKKYDLHISIYGSTVL